MKVGVKGLARDEKGAAMILVLLLLLVGGLITAPLLAFTGNGVLNGEVYEDRTAEVYAADAGVEDALWRIQHGDVVLCPGNPSYGYPIPDSNGKTVNVTITSVTDFQGLPNLTGTYRIESTAMGDGSSTGIEAYVTAKNKYGDYAGLLNQIVITQGEIEAAKKVYLCYTEGHGPLENYNGTWPKQSELADFYWQDVKDEEPYSSSTINIAGVDSTIGPLYRDGTLDIKNSSGTPATLQLTGTLYVTGDTAIAYGTSLNKEMTLDLNGHTIFVMSDSTGSGQEALKIGDKCNIKGPGCIIAVGDIYFKPKSQLTTDPIFVLSVSGKTWLQPNGNIYGTIAGSVEVDLQPGTSLVYPTGGFGDVNFLVGVQKLVYSIASWELSQQ